ncbi:MAG: pseudouridine synthase [Gemmatimonadota bacterium]|nr:pseudouridine synthase [Gemmatimonadota bacterium]MDH5198209.1 pseudouridine synthase [Gemmatimonadota bacterium]
MRLQRALARAGVRSRRAAETLIEEGRVRVNGRVATLGSSADPETDRITVDGKPLRPAASAWIALNKPVGCVVSRHDAEGRATVFQLVPSVPGLTYVGRLDVMTGGLLLLTTDGTLVHRLTHPRYEVEKTYRVRVHGRSAAEIRTSLARPVLVDGRAVAMQRPTVRPVDGGSTDVQLVLTEGRNRIVRRLCEVLGLKVERLTRISHGPVQLGRLAPGAWRYLTPREIAALQALRD